MNNGNLLDISWSTIWKVFIAVILFYIVYQIRDILVWFIFALIISILLNPAIDFFKKLKVPRSLAVAFIYIGIFGLLSLIIYLMIPLFSSEVQRFSQILPQYFEKVSPPLRGIGVQAFKDIETFLATLAGALNKIAVNIFNILFAIFGGIFTTIFILTLAVFLSLEEKGIEKKIVLLFPKKYENYALLLWGKCQKKVSNWFLTRIIGCLFVGLLSLATFLLFNTPYPFSLGLLAGFLNFIPIAGPLLAGTLIFVVVSLESLSKAIFVLIVFILIQQIENNVLMPLLSKKMVGLSPILVLLALAIGGVLWGFLGAILSIPLAGILAEFLKDFLKKKKEEEATT